MRSPKGGYKLQYISVSNVFSLPKKYIVVEQFSRISPNLIIFFFLQKKKLRVRTGSTFCQHFFYVCRWKENKLTEPVNFKNQFNSQLLTNLSLNGSWFCKVLFLELIHYMFCRSKNKFINEIRF